MLRKRVASPLLAVTAIGVVGLLGGASAHPPASHLHSGEYCTKSLQTFYHRHEYTCKRGSDGALRLFSY